MLVNPSRLSNAGSFSMGAVPRFWFCSIESEHLYGVKGRYVTLVQNVICSQGTTNLVGVMSISSTCTSPRHTHNVLRQCFIFCSQVFPIRELGVVSASFRGSRCLAMEYMHAQPAQRERTTRQRPTAAGRPVIWDKWQHFRGIGAHLPARWLYAREKI